MSDPYFARRLIAELRLAEQAVSEEERTVRLRACYLLCSLLNLKVARAHDARRRSRIAVRRSSGPEAAGPLSPG